MILRFAVFIIFILQGCSFGKQSESAKLRIGVDSSWEALNFGPQTAYVNGFIEDFLREIAQYESLEFEKISANWDTLFTGLKEKNYDAVLTALPPYTFNLGKYDFSQNFLDLGPVFIVSVDAADKNLEQIKDRTIGILSGDSADRILRKYPTIRVRGYPSIPDLLNAAVNGDVAGVLLDRIPAVNYVSDLYAGKLRVVSGPLDDKGLHLIAEKGEETEMIQKFDRGIKALKKKKKLKMLLKKWSL